MLCKECSKKDTCRELCPEAEKYASQDYVSQDAMLFGNPPNGGEGISNGRDEIILRMFFIERKTQVEIAETLTISQSAVSQRIAKYKGLMSQIIKKVLISVP